MHKYSCPLTFASLTLLMLSCIVTSLPLAAAQSTNATIPASPTATPPPQVNILWNTSKTWDLKGTPAENLSTTGNARMEKVWGTSIIADSVLYGSAASTVFRGPYGDFGASWINVYAFNASNGDQLWNYQSNLDKVSNIAVLDGRVFFGVNTGMYGAQANNVSCLYALNASTGDFLWRTLCSIFSTTPVAENNTVFVNSNHSILALDCTSGRILWNYTTGDIIVYTPVASQGMLYAASSDCNLYALNATEGSRVWSFNVGTQFLGITVVDGVIYASSGDGNLYALDALTGTKIWVYGTSAPEYSWTNLNYASRPIYIQGMLYLSSISGQQIDISTPTHRGAFSENIRFAVIALNAGTGHKIWNYTSATSEFGSPFSVVNGVVYTSIYASTLGFNAYTGDLVWNYTNNDINTQATAVTANGTLYINCRNGQTYAIALPELNITPPQGFDLQKDASNFDVPYSAIAGISVVAVIIGAVFWVRHKHQKTIKPSIQP